jgi:hypothetical protein
MRVARERDGDDGAADAGLECAFQRVHLPIMP